MKKIVSGPHVFRNRLIGNVGRKKYDLNGHEENQGNSYFKEIF